VFHTAQQMSVYFTIQALSRMLRGKVKDKGLKQLCHDSFLKMAHFQDWCETNFLNTYCSYFVDAPGVLVTTKTGVCCSESRNPTSVEKFSRLCNISGDIFLFTS